MTNAEKTQRFFAATDASTKSDVLANIASHYGISQESALEEVLDEEAEHLLDGVEIEIAELYWANGSRSFECVHIKAEEIIGIADDMPTDALLLELLQAYRGQS